MNLSGTQAAVQHLADEPMSKHDAARHPETGRTLLSYCHRPVFGNGDAWIIAALIDVRGKPMIQWVVDNLNVEAKYIFIVQKSHFEKYNLKDTLNNFCPNNEIVQVDGITEGAACTTLLAKQYIDKDEPLIIANSDQFVEWNSEEFIYSCSTADLDANILTFKSTHPKWSYTKLNEFGYVTEVAEKKPISDIATVGIYYWRKGSDYVKYAEQMISKNIRVNNEFYVCPVFNEAIEDGKKIRTFNIEKMWGLGTPEDLENFLKNYNEDNRSSWKS